MNRRELLVAAAASAILPGAKLHKMGSAAMQQMKIHIPQHDILDLQERLKRTRWPDEVGNAGWDYGTNLTYLRELCGYWASGFDWRKQEARLNSFSHHLADAGGQRLHFILERGRGPKPAPLVLFHGWPGSFHQMLKLVPLLTDPASHGGSGEDSFDVIIPSLPGYGFSSKPKVEGWNQTRFASAFAELMTTVLGYDQYFAHGGDIGAGVVNRLGLDHHQNVIAIHLTNVASPYRGPGARPLTERESQLVAEEEEWTAEEGAYADLQRTRPQSLAYGLNDSPAGLAAWIIEKWRAWSDCRGDLESIFTRDELLTNLSIYWFTETIGSSMRVYYEHRKHSLPLGRSDRIVPPAGFALFPHDLSHPPREWAERSYQVESWTEMPRGGHFSPIEQPELLAADITRFFRRYRSDGLQFRTTLRGDASERSG